MTIGGKFRKLFEGHESRELWRFGCARGFCKRLNQA